MDNIQKFLADANRIKKHYRQQNANYDGVKVCEQICANFEKINNFAPSLAQALSQYWLDTYILKSKNAENEPSEENLLKLVAFLALLQSENATEQDFEALTEKDWNEIKDLVNYEAEDLPLDLLNDLMSILVGKVKFD